MIRRGSLASFFKVFYLVRVRRDERTNCGGSLPKLRLVLNPPTAYVSLGKGFGILRFH